jgi:ribonuclease G
MAQMGPVASQEKGRGIMKKEIIVNADELESRVAILEDGQVAELQVEREPRMVGNIYKARVVSVLPGMDAAFADIGLEKNVFLCVDDVGFVSRDGFTAVPPARATSIAQRLKEKQEVVVQIVRAPVGGKGARATTRLALPGRYLVLLLSDASQVGVSRKIEDRKERERLRKIGDQIRPKGTGIIVRTEAEGRGRKELEADLRVLLDLRERVKRKASRAKAPALLHQDLTLTYQMIRDVFTDDVSALIIDSKSVYDNAVELVKSIAPRLRRRVKRYRARLPIFHKYDIESEIDRLLRRRVWLAAGGYISIDQAEAFTAIDVNTGRYTGSTGLAETILRTNLEAAEEIARQLRLRDLGGIIAIDFIDMERARHRQRVTEAFEKALERDRQRTKILHLSPLGIVEMTRKRRGESLMGVLTDPCQHCAGIGRVRKPLTIALKLERELCSLAAEEKVAAAVVRAAPTVAAYLIGEEGEHCMSLERRMGGFVYIRAEHGAPAEDYEVRRATRAEAAGAVRVYSRGDELRLDHVDGAAMGQDQDVSAWAGDYRVVVEDGGRADEGAAIVLSEAGRSFGRGRLKEARKAERPGKGQAKQAKSAKQPRRRSRRKSKARRETARGSEKAAKQQVGRPESDEQHVGEQEAVADKKGAPKKVGLLRRGARRIVRARR